MTSYCKTVIYDNDDEHIKYDIMTKFIRSGTRDNIIIVQNDDIVNGTFRDRAFYNKLIKHMNKDKNIKWHTNNLDNVVEQLLNEQLLKILNARHNATHNATQQYIIMDNCNIN